MWKNLFRKKTVQSILHESHTAGNDAHTLSLNRTLSVRDLTSFGIAAIIGAGIFSTIGNASASGGPAVTLLFIFTALACGLSALSYAEFASTIPVSGSAYTYAYASFGELVAWIIGWDLLMEYAIGNIAVAISWSDYFTGLLHGLQLHIPEYLTMDYLSALRGFKEASAALLSGAALTDLSPALQEKYLAWNNAPLIGTFRFILDIPALLITVFITYLVYIGIRETRMASNIMVMIKLLVVIAVIMVGFFYINPANWSPFAPNGMTGVLKGVSAVFFAYIGFDAISTTAEECKNPQRDLPRAMFYSLIICTVLYILIALTLTGMVNYSELGVGDPLSYVFKQVGLDWFSGVIAVSAVFAMASVLLVFQLGQPRIWMSMSRDGLLPRIFSRIHPKFKTPSFATIVTGFLVATPALFMNLTEVTDLTSIGTLFAFAVVNGGVLVLHQQPDNPNRNFRTPYINGKWIFPALVILGFFAWLRFAPEAAGRFFSFSDPENPAAGQWDIFLVKIPAIFFILLTALMMILSIIKDLSLLPTLGLVSCTYLISELGITNWIRFLVWLIVGLAIYFIYGYRNSRLHKAGKMEKPV